MGGRPRQFLQLRNRQLPHLAVEQPFQTGLAQRLYRLRPERRTDDRAVTGVVVAELVLAYAANIA